MLKPSLFEQLKLLATGIKPRCAVMSGFSVWTLPIARRLTVSTPGVHSGLTGLVGQVLVYWNVPFRADCVKTPLRLLALPSLWLNFSYEKKKNALSFPLETLGPPSPNLGKYIGPPMSKPY